MATQWVIDFFFGFSLAASNIFSISALPLKNVGLWSITIKYIGWGNNWCIIPESPRWKDVVSNAAVFKIWAAHQVKLPSPIVLVLSYRTFLLTVPNHIFLNILCKSRCKDPTWQSYGACSVTGNGIRSLCIFLILSYSLIRKVLLSPFYRWWNWVALSISLKSSW